MKIWKTFLFALVASVSAAASVAHARQERDQSYPQTRTWKVAQLDPLTWNDSVSGTRVDVIDTAGVCIYVARWDKGMAVTSVPKTQLPRGAGCQ